jgi:hypothetical protein
LRPLKNNYARNKTRGAIGFVLIFLWLLYLHQVADAQLTYADNFI